MEAPSLTQNRAKRSPTTYPLEWHRECLTNSRMSLAQRQRELQRLQVEVQRHADEVGLYEAQIAEAERRGLDAFDRERLLVAKRAPAATRQKDA